MCLAYGVLSASKAVLCEMVKKVTPFFAYEYINSIKKSYKMKMI